MKYESFVPATKEMNYAQSIVTTQIQKLETDLGVQLMKRL
ncbi:helix-turn-helix domain-containing protein [Brevibacillus daliensis]|nr:LysR family transcriptional regulator [Brevibacillus daliensis]